MKRRRAAAVFDHTSDYVLDPLEVQRFLGHYFRAEELLGQSVLDAGCRVGDFSAGLLARGARRVCGVDLSAACVARARERFRGAPGFAFFEGDIAALTPFGDSEFDLSVCIGTIMYLPPERALAALRELVRVTRPGGSVLVLFLRERGPLARIVTAIANGIPLRPYLWLAERCAPLLLPVAGRLLGHEVDRAYLKHYVLLGARGLHFGVPADLPDRFLVPTVQSRYGSPTTTVSYRIRLPEGGEKVRIEPRRRGARS